MKIVLCFALFAAVSAAVVGNSQHAFLISSGSAAVHGKTELKKDAKAAEKIRAKDDMKNEDDGGDDAADDADDDDEDDVVEEKADSSKAKDATAKQGGIKKKEDNEAKAKDAKAKEAASKHEAKVKEAKVALDENRADQKRLQTDLAKVDHLQDANASTKEIDAIAQLVMKETESKALATMMGSIWKELRMFEVPGYATHTEAEIANLEKAETVLKANLAKVQARLDKKDEPKKEKESDDIAEGGIAKFEKKAESGAAVVWDEKSKLPKPVQYILVGLWILMIASMPVLIPIMDKKPATPTQKITGLTMLVVLFGGFYLFTNIILFQSVHFKSIRSLTPVECIYFMSQIITTVGYGDITPAKMRGQIFVALYVVGALFVIAMFVSDMTAHVGKMAVEYRKKKMEDVKNTPRTRQRSESGHHQTGFQAVCELIKPHKPSMLPLLSALGIFAALALCWVVFFSLHPDEKKTLFQAIYMSIITLSTVGFGYFTPLTEEGMIFGAFWMLFGAGALANAIGNFTDYTVKKSEYEQAQNEEHSKEVALLKRQLSGSQNVSELQFLKFCLLQTKLASPEELQNITEAYQSLISDSPTRGVSLKAVEEILEHQDNDPALFQGGK